MSVRAESNANALTTMPQDMGTAIAEATPDNHQLAEGGAYSTATPENPLIRNLAVSIRASLNELCLQKNRGVWQPSPEALKAIFQQKRFTALDGTSESMGDLKSVVLHDMKVSHVKSSFPMSLGAKITAVDDKTYSSTGEAFSTIILPNSESTTARTLQADDVSLAYEFSRKFPGYTADNLSVEGIHEVAQKRFVLISADHPIISAISENADKLQMGEIAMMPEGLVKISQSLYESILPLVKTQVESQIKVRDLSRASVTLAPAEYTSWSEARSELMIEGKRPLKAQLQAELASATEAQAEELRAEFDAREKAFEHDLDHTQRDVHLMIECSYNFLSK